MRVLDVFSGVGLMSLGLGWAGMRTVGFCEIEPACRFWLREQWPTVPIFEDVRSLTGEGVLERCGAVDLVAGGFPCQPVSVAGARRGTEDARWLWPEMFRIVRELRPRWVLAENVPGLRTPIATAQDSIGSGSAGYSTESGRHPGTTLTDAANGTWATPQTRNRKSERAMAASTDNGRRTGGGNSSPPGLEQQAELCAGIVPTEMPEPENLPAATRAMLEWATPTSRDWRSGHASEATHARNARPLSEQATRLSSEESSPDPGSDSASGKRRDWRTPSATVFEPKPEGTKLSGRSPKDPQVGLADQARGSLNPDWVGQLMGAPDGWLATDPPRDVLVSARGATASTRRSSPTSAAPSRRRS
jgi:site-specific DNA-cytosine methylase